VPGLGDQRRHVVTGATQLVGAVERVSVHDLAPGALPFDVMPGQQQDQHDQNDQQHIHAMR
jgi:hypothetical protein